MDDPISYLVRRRFPDVKVLREEALGPITALTAERLRDLEAYEAELKAKPVDEVAKLAKVEHIKQASESLARETAKHTPFFEKPHAAADFDHWSKMPYWALEEAVSLSFGKEPSVVNWDTLKSCTNIYPFARAYERVRDLATRAYRSGQLYDHVLPGVFIGWARRLDIAFPEALEAKVVQRGGFVSDWKTAYDDLEAKYNELQKGAVVLDKAFDALKDEYDKALVSAASAAEESSRTIAEVKQERDALALRVGQLEAMHALTAQEKPLSTREKESLLKLIIGMATGGYGFDPSAAKSSQVRHITDDVLAAGLTIDEDTVRKWVKEAVGLLPAEEARSAAGGRSAGGTK